MRERIGLAAVGLAQGLAVWLLVERWPEAQTARAVAVGLLSFLAVSGAVLHFAWTGERVRRLVALAVGVGLVYGLVATWVGMGLPREGAVSSAGNERVASWILAVSVTLYVLGPFLQVLQRSGRLAFPYEELFLHAWNNFFVALVAALFTGALWAVLLLWGALFGLIGIDFFRDLFTGRLFTYAATGAALGFGLALGRESERVVATLRSVTLKVFGGLLPLVCFVAVLFLATLPFTGLGPLWDTDHASQLLLGWAVVTVLFFNAVYQEGRRASPLPRAARRLVEAGLLALIAFLAISAWGFTLRIRQYGLTPTRMWGGLLWCVLAAYALGYGVAVLRRGSPWLPSVRPVNRAVAWGVVALGLLAHTPVLDPLAWSARSQVARLLDGRVGADAFDYGYLRFQLGEAGTQRFEELAGIGAHPELAAIRAGVARAREVESYRAWQDTARPGPDVQQLRVAGGAAALPAGLLDAIGRTRELKGERCEAGRLCLAFPAEISGGAPEEWVVALGWPRWPMLYVFRQESAGSFSYDGQLTLMGPLAAPVDFRAAIQEGRARSVPAPDRDLLIEGARFRLRR